MKYNLILQAIIKDFSGLVLVELLLFLSAGTFTFWNAWLFIVLLFVPMLIMGIVLLFIAPELLAKRLNNKEKKGAQKKVVGLTALIFIVGFILIGLDFRFGWSKLGSWIAFIIFLGYPVLITKRIRNEEKVLEKGLEGYSEYKQKVKYKILPFIW